MRLFISILLVIYLAGCGSQETDSKVSTQDSIKTEQLRLASAKKIKVFGLSLKSELMAAINKGGVVNAVSVCEEKAPMIAASHSSEGWSIRRVSDRNRSPENLADQHQKDILKAFSDTALHLEYFDEWIHSDTDSSYYFYKPIYVGKLCLRCHGKSKVIDNEVKTVIKEKYPDDKAIGYSEGELRGMFVLKVTPPLDVEELKTMAVDSL